LFGYTVLAFDELVFLGDGGGFGLDGVICPLLELVEVL
jgi:hypothetical protein